MMLLLHVLIQLAGAAPPERGECAEHPRAALVQALQASEVAWHNLDGDALDAAMGRVRAATACLSDVADLDLVLMVHQAHARHAWTTYDPQASARAWLAVRDLAPEWTRAYEEDVPKDHPVRELWVERPQWTATLDEVPPGGWRIDGVESRDVPLDRAFFIQAIGRKGGIAYSGWHQTANDVPQSPWRTERVARLRKRGTVVAGVMGLAGAGLIAGALVDRARIQNVNTPARDIPDLQKRANALGGTGMALVGTSLVTVGVLWGVRW